MIGIDTNVLVRVLVDDEKAVDQCQKARALLLQHDRIFLSMVVVTETIWVLQRVYAVGKDQILTYLNRLLLQKELVFENRPLIQRACEIYRGEKCGFSDALILASHESRQCLLYTFDKTLAGHTRARDLAQIATPS